MSAFTYHVWMNSCAASNDLNEAERIYGEMRRVDGNMIDWRTYSNLAAIYVKAEQFEKAEVMLRMMEEEIKPHEREAYHCLLSLYAGTRNRGEVYRVWDHLKSFSPVINTSYLVMLSTLRRLNDIEGITKCLEEWESQCVTYDIRMVSVAVNAYLRHDMDEEAESVLKRATMRCKGPFFKIREMFMMFYLKKDQLDGALSHLQAAHSEATIWRPSPEVVGAFLKYYDEKTDLDGVDELCKILDTNDDDSCLKTCDAASESSPEIDPILKEDSYVNHAQGNL